MRKRPQGWHGFLRHPDITASRVGLEVWTRLWRDPVGAGSVSAFSAATQAVQAANAPPANTSPPTIMGTARQGTLTASPGIWSGTQPNQRRDRDDLNAHID
jgi:hypothetical protein